MQLDMLTGAVCGIDLVDGRAADQTLPIQHAPLPAGSLRLADLGFFTMTVLQTLTDAGTYWLSRIQTNSCLRLPGQRKQSILEVVTALRTADTWESPILLGVHVRVAARLLIQRVPAAVAAQRRRRIEDEAHRKQRPIATDALALAEWTIVITNVPPDQLSLAEAMVLMKIRWHIELFFKLWKSHGQVDEWRTKKPARILCEIYAKLIGLLFQHWVLVVSAWDNPERSAMKAAKIVMAYATELAMAQHDPVRFLTVMLTLAQAVRRWARMQKRQKRPSTAQRLLALSTGAG